MRRTALSVLFIVLAGCASTPQSEQSVQLRDLTVGNEDVDLLSDLMRREDNRQYDVAAFDGFLNANSTIVRAFAARALGRIGNTAASAQLIRALNDQSLEVRAEAAFALGELGDSSVQVTNALGALAGGSSVDAAEAVSSLGKLRTDAARVHVERLLASGASSPVLQEALLAVWRFPRRPATTALIAKYLNHQDEEIRWRAAYALTRGPADPVVVPALIDVVRSSRDRWTPSFAARGLRAASADSANRRADAMAALLSRTTDPSPAVRINATVTLGAYRDSANVPALAGLLLHDDPNTRTAVTQTLAASGGSLAIRLLGEKAVERGERADVRGAALAALMNVSPEVAIRIAEENLRNDQWLVRLYVARALGGARGSAGLAGLRQLASDRDSRVAVAAVEAAAGTRDTLPAARALFIQQLAATDPFVRAAALAGLERFADPADQILLFDAFARAQRDSVPEAAVAALDAIGKLVQKNAAVDRAFRVRFPGSNDCLHPDVRRALTRHFQIADNCGANATVRVYEQAIRDLVAPSLRGTNPRARITTAGTTIDIELLAAAAPLTVRNFISLAERGYFNGSRWHRVVPNFVLQDGDPYGNGSGGPGYAIRDEMNRVRYLDGTVGMALSGPDTGGSQFFITHSPQPHLDGGYTVFGRVVPRLSPAAYLIAQDDVIERIEIIR